MEKPSFLNRKFIIIMIVLLVLVGGGVGLYFLLKPKPDFDDAYNKNYELIHNSEYTTFYENNASIISMINNVKESDLNGVANADTISSFMNRYSNFNVIIDSYSNLEDTLNENLLFVNKSDKEYVNTQKLLDESAKVLNENLTNSKSEFDTYLSPSKISEYSKITLWQKLTNYNTFSAKTMQSLNKFYENISTVFNEHLSNSISVNPLTKLTVKSSCLWATNCVNVSIENISVSYGELNGAILLKSFTKTHNDYSNSLYYEYTNKINSILSLINSFDLNEIVLHLANGTTAVWVGQMEEQNASNASTVLNKYFKTTDFKEEL